MTYIDWMIRGPKIASCNCNAEMASGTFKASGDIELKSSGVYGFLTNVTYGPYGIIENKTHGGKVT